MNNKIIFSKREHQEKILSGHVRFRPGLWGGGHRTFDTFEFNKVYVNKFYNRRTNLFLFSFCPLNGLIREGFRV